MFGPLVSAFNALPPFRGKQRILKTAFGPLPFSHARSHYGVKMVKNAADSTWRACMVGSYGRFIADYIAGLSEAFVFLDIGANQGLFGLCAARNLHCRQVIPVEPNPATHALLLRNIQLSDTPDKFSPLRGALCDPAVGTVEMSVPQTHSGASSMTIAAAEGDEHFEAPAYGGAHLAEMMAPHRDAAIHAKIDVEGAELIVLEELQCSGMLTRISSIIIEISEKTRSGNSDDISGFFVKHNWPMVARDGAANHFDAVFENPHAKGSA